MNGLEIERYELHQPIRRRFALDRREFFRLVGGGLVVVLLLDGAEAQQGESGARRRGGFGGGAQPADIASWLHIGEDGAVTVYTGKVEVGQNARTSLTQAVAEELRAPVGSIRLVMGDTELCPFDAGTFGSGTTPRMWPQLRRVAAAAREVLLDLAAERFKADRAILVVADARISNPSTHESVPFGELTKGQKLLKQISSAALTPATDWKIAGKPIAKVDGRSIVTGKHRYSSDVSRPGMLHGGILRPPAISAKLKSADVKPAQAMKCVTVVQDGDFIGLTAPDPLTVAKALNAVRAEWETSPQPSDKELYTYLKANQTQGRGGAGGFGGGSGAQGSVDSALAAADKKLHATYTIAYIAHTPLEPRAAVAEWNGGKLTVWTGTQRPFGVKGELASAFGIPESSVRVIVPDTGSGYGGKHTGEAAVEAARLAKAAGKPVKLVWTREEEFTWAYFRPAGVIEVQSGAMKDGTLTAWDFHNYNSGGSGIRTMYEVPNQRNEFHGTRSPLRQGSYRALASTANHFARESHMDELAHAAAMDPLAFRLKNLKDTRFRAVLEESAKAFGWGKRASLTPGPSPNSGRGEAARGQGIAGGFEKNAYVATCAEVSVDKKTGKVRVVRAVTAFDCGAVVNPDHLKNQIEGGVTMGIGGALFEAIRFENGAILNPRFSKYRVPRFSDAPILETVLIDRKDLPSAGAGETPIVCIAPALGNAIFDAVGVRLRSLPMAPDGVKA